MEIIFSICFVCLICFICFIYILFIKKYSKEDVIKAQNNSKIASENARLLYEKYCKDNRTINVETVIKAQNNAYETAKNARLLYEQFL